MMNSWLRRKWIVLSHWEFWPTWIVYLPVLCCYPFWVLRNGSIFFFALANPKITMGGLYGSSKEETLKQLPDSAKPRTKVFDKTITLNEVIAAIKHASMNYPLVIKPEYGERGKGIEVVRNAEHLGRALTAQTSRYSIQEYIDLPFEAGVFYIKKPGANHGEVTSIVTKGFLKITGDGHSTIEQLTKKKMRGFLVWDKLKFSLESDKVLEIGEEIILEPIGNHSRGTAFNNGNHLITEKVVEWADRIAINIPEFYYGRFDVRAPSEESFVKGGGLKVLEVNGANAEPGHIYQEGASLFDAWVTLVQYWSVLSDICRYNHKRHSYPSIKEAHAAYATWQTINTKKQNS